MCSNIQGMHKFVLIMSHFSDLWFQNVFISLEYFYWAENLTDFSTVVIDNFLFAFHWNLMYFISKIKLSILPDHLTQDSGYTVLLKVSSDWCCTFCPCHWLDHKSLSQHSYLSVFWLLIFPLANFLTCHWRKYSECISKHHQVCERKLASWLQLNCFSFMSHKLDILMGSRDPQDLGLFFLFPNSWSQTKVVEGCHLEWAWETLCLWKGSN